jgi:trimethylamine--corrinoid protein Co-methyltransferase
MTDSRLATWDRSAFTRVHEATLAILADPGVDVHHDDALRLLAQAGAHVDGVRARIPAELVERALASAPRSFPLTARGGLEPLVIEDGQVYFGTGGDCRYTRDFETGERRLSRLSDVGEQAALAERLPNIDFVMSMSLPADVRETEIDVMVVAELLRATRKPLMVCATCSPGTLALLQRMTERCGEKDSLIIYTMPSPPLAVNGEAVARIMACAELGIRMVFATSSAPGVTAPCSLAGMIIASNAELLSALVIHQLAKPGAPFVYGGQHVSISMSTSTNLYCAPETMALQQVGTECGRFYGLPTFTFGGCTDSKTLDGQWASETATSIVLAALSGSTLIHDVGYVESSFLATHESVVFADELAGYVRAYLRGVQLHDLDAAVDEIRAVGPGGDHLGRSYTRKHYRELWQPTVIDQWMHDHWAADGEKTLVDRLHQKAAALRLQGPAFSLEPDVEVELAALVAEGVSA